MWLCRGFPTHANMRMASSNEYNYNNDRNPTVLPDPRTLCVTQILTYHRIVDQTQHLAHPDYTYVDHVESEVRRDFSQHQIAPAFK